MMVLPNFFYVVDNNSGWFKFKQKITGSIDGGTRNAEIKVPSKRLSNFWRTLERLFINFEINLILTWS